MPWRGRIPVAAVWLQDIMSAIMILLIQELELTSPGAALRRIG